MISDENTGEPALDGTNDDDEAFSITDQTALTEATADDNDVPQENETALGDEA